MQAIARASPEQPRLSCPDPGRRRAGDYERLLCYWRLVGGNQGINLIPAVSFPALQPFLLSPHAKLHASTVLIDAVGIKNDFKTVDERLLTVQEQVRNVASL